MSAERHRDDLLERGYTVIEGSHSAEDVAAFRERLTRLHREHGSPRPYAHPETVLTRQVMLNPTGFVVFQLVALAPELAPRLMSQRVVDVARKTLGDDMHVELTGAVLCDESRPFFSWHNHIGGIDVEDYRARRDFPRFTRSQRLISVLYLDDIDEQGGELLALPRRITDPTEPHADQRSDHWPGQVTLRFPAGSTLVFEQCTWHAVRPQLRTGLRMFVGCYFTASDAPKTSAIDDSLVGFTGGGPLLQSVLKRT